MNSNSGPCCLHLIAPNPTSDSAASLLRVSQLEFVTDPAEREQLLADGKLSCFNGLRLDGFESVDYGIAEASSGVQRILFHIRTILANDDLEV